MAQSRASTCYVVLSVVKRPDFPERRFLANIRVADNPTIAAINGKR